MSSTSASLNEKEALRARLEDGRQKWLAAIRDVSEQGALFSPGEGQWNILQVAEHVATAERQMLTMWKKLSAPGTSPREKDQVILTAQGDRSTKRPAPERSLPSGRFASLRDAEKAFVQNREATLATLAEAEDLCGKVVEHPLAGVCDGYQLFLIMAVHPVRHAYQVEEIKAAPGFGK
ncbi:MAG TPA: DinB family protein [Terriglobales bacterium]